MTPLLALLAFQAVTFAPEKDPQFAKPVTVHLALSPLKTVVAALSKGTGQPMSVSGAVSDLKATVLVKDLPAGRTMEALADTLGLAWKVEGGAILLGRPDGASSAESSYLSAERTAQQKLAVLPRPSATAPAESAAMPGRPRRGPGMRRGPEETAAAEATYTRFDPNLLAVEVGDGEPPSRLKPATPVGESAFAKAVRAWPSVPTTVDDAWRRPISLPQFGRSTWESGAFALSDLLVAFHDATGLPVVADAFRVPTHTRIVAPGPALGVLQTIASADAFSLKLSDGVVRMRHPAFWRLRPQEVPETAWRELEGSGAPSLASLASFAAGLSAPQVAAFRSAEAPLSHVPTVAIRNSYPGLMLWSALPDAARRALLAGQPVALSAVQGAADAYGYALREAPYYHGGDPTRILRMSPAAVGIFGAASGRSLELRLAGERGGGVSYVLPL